VNVPHTKLLRLIAVAMLALVGLLAGGCGGEEEGLDVVEGEPIEVGELEYNVLFTRYLNPGDVEDAEYLQGQPPLPPNTQYLGVFLQVENLDEDRSGLLPAHFTIIDTDENVYDAIPSESSYALELGTEIDPGGEVPEADSTAEVGPIEGSLILFRISDETAEKRPLKLIVPGLDGPAQIELDI
jgi:hypothetical protein